MIQAVSTIALMYLVYRYILVRVYNKIRGSRWT